MPMKKKAQISMFDSAVSEGDWVETKGRQLTFDEIAARTGELIVIDMSTQSHEWYRAVLVVRIIYYDGTRRLIFSDGGKHAGYVDERYFTSGSAKAYEIA